MLQITITGTEYYDESTETFVTVDDVMLEFEHSLVSLSKWESKFEKPFLGPDEKTSEEVLWYIQCMLQTEDYPDDIFQRLSAQNIKQINDYIDSKQSATTIREQKRHGPIETITAELIYYWMIAFNIPFECQHWHLNKLFALIRICSAKNGKPQKMSRNELAERNQALNEQRRAKLGTTG
jgi:hypothetical protein